MILTETAQGHLAALEAFYQERGRDASIVSMAEALVFGFGRIEHGEGPFLPAPCPYPDLARYGWQWLKSRSYWIAFEQSDGAWTVTAVFYETANMPGRL